MSKQPDPQTALRAKLDGLSAAEEFFQYFTLPFEQAALNINRLHILKRYQQYLSRNADLAELDDAALFARHRDLLAQAYQDFQHSNAVAEKVFKVFHQALGHQHIALDSLRTQSGKAEEAATCTS